MDSKTALDEDHKKDMMLYASSKYIKHTFHYYYLVSSIHVLNMGEGSLATHVVIGTPPALQVLIECFEVEEYLQSIL